MGTKIGVLVGLGAGYLLGTKAGRERYEQIKSAARRFRDHPVVSKPLDNASERVADAVRNQGERVTDKVADAVKERLFGTRPVQDVDYVDVDIEIQEDKGRPTPFQP